MILFGDKVFAEVINLKWSRLGQSLMQYDCYCYKKRNFRHRHIHRKCHVMMKAELGVMPQKSRNTKDFWQTARSWGKNSTNFCFSSQKGLVLLILWSQTTASRSNRCLLLKPSSLWFFVKAALTWMESLTYLSLLPHLPHTPQLTGNLTYVSSLYSAVAFSSKPPTNHLLVACSNWTFFSSFPVSATFYMFIS